MIDDFQGQKTPLIFQILNRQTAKDTDNLRNQDSIIEPSPDWSSPDWSSPDWSLNSSKSQHKTNLTMM